MKTSFLIQSALYIGVLFFPFSFCFPQDVLVANVNIVDVENDTILPGKDVLIRGGEIHLIKNHNGTYPAYRVDHIDGTGQYLIPGLWDMHVHPNREEDLKLYIANGVIGIRIMWGNPIHLSWREEIKQGERTGPKMYMAGPIIEGTPPKAFSRVVSVEGRRIVDKKKQAYAAVADQVEEGYDFIKVYNNLPKPAYQAIIKAAKKEGVAVAGHIPFEVGLMEALKQGQKSIEHLRGYIQHLVPKDAPQQPGIDLRSRELSWEFIDPDKIRELAVKTAKSSTWNCPTLVVSRILYPQEMMDQLAQKEENKYLPKETVDFFKSDRSTIPWLSNFTDEDYQQVFENLKKKQLLVKALSEAGAKILSGTDTWLAGFDLHEELVLLSESGLSNYEVLRTATLYPAQYFDLESEFGSIKTRKTANMVMLSANPIEDIRNTRKITYVFQDKKVMNILDLEDLLESCTKR